MLENWHQYISLLTHIFLRHPLTLNLLTLYKTMCSKRHPRHRHTSTSMSSGLTAFLTFMLFIAGLTSSSLILCKIYWNKIAIHTQTCPAKWLTIKAGPWSFGGGFPLPSLVVRDSPWIWLESNWAESLLYKVCSNGRRLWLSSSNTHNSPWGF